MKSNFYLWCGIMKLIEILGLYKAIKCTAKKYHWKTAGDNFMSDHLLFDRIYDDISDDSIDSIAEHIIWV